MAGVRVGDNVGEVRGGLHGQLGGDGSRADSVYPLVVTVHYNIRILVVSLRDWWRGCCAGGERRRKQIRSEDWMYVLDTPDAMSAVVAGQLSCEGQYGSLRSGISWAQE